MINTLILNKKHIKFITRIDWDLIIKKDYKNISKSISLVKLFYIKYELSLE